MKKLMMLSAVCLLTLSSLEMSAKNKDKKLSPPSYTTVNYTCPSSPTTLRNFSITSTSTTADKQTVANVQCGGATATLWKPVQ